MISGHLPPGLKTKLGQVPPGRASGVADAGGPQVRGFGDFHLYLSVLILSSHLSLLGLGMAGCGEYERITVGAQRS